MTSASITSFLKQGELQALVRVPACGTCAWVSAKGLVGVPGALSPLADQHRLQLLGRNAMQRDASQAPDAWAALRVGVDPSGQLGFGCDGDDAGERLARLFLDEMGRWGFTGVHRADGFTPSSSQVVALNWNSWTFGQELGTVGALFEEVGGLDAPEVMRPEGPAPLRCPACVVVDTPLRRVFMPPPLLDRHAPGVREVLGDVIFRERPEGLVAPVECPACGAGFVPAGFEPDAVIRVLFGPADSPVRDPASNRLYQVGPRLVWVPAFRAGRDDWKGQMPFSVRHALDRNPVSWMALRLVGSAVLLLPRWSMRNLFPRGFQEVVSLRVEAQCPTIVHGSAGGQAQGFFDPQHPLVEDGDGGWGP